MKTKVATIIVAGIVAVASFSLADSSSSPPKPAGDVVTISRELQQTQAQLKQVVARISVLEEQVRALQKSNAELQKMIGKFVKPHLTPIQTR